MDSDPSRRRLLLAFGAGTGALAGCLDSFDDGATANPTEQPPDEERSPADDNDDGSEETETGTIRWPAIEAGEVISDFEDLDRWEPREARLAPAPDEARTGSQAVVVESDDERAGMSITFPDGLDLEGWNTSMAVKPESATRIVVEFFAPSGDERLASVRILPNDYDDWFRLDCGYEHKPADEPDISNVTRINVVAVGPDGGPTRLLVDDLRRTEAVDNGKAILAFYGGLDSTYEIAAPLLAERGWVGAVPVTPGRIGGSGRMDLDELHDLRDSGWDICSLPRGDGDLADMSAEAQRETIETVARQLADNGFPDGSRHFFAPNWRQLTPTTHEIVRDVHETGFVFGSCPTGAPPTGLHTIPMIWGPALHSGVRRHINLADQYTQLTVLRIPRIVEDEADVDANSMPLADFEHLLDHLEHRGVDVITPSDLVDGLAAGSGGGGSGGDRERPDGRIFEAGASHSFEGSGTSLSDEFDLEAGLLTATVSHDGTSPLVVNLLSAAGDRGDERLVTASDESAESMLIVPDGAYQLDVDADGAWSIDLDQPEVHSDELADLPVEQSGSGTSFVGPLWTEGDVRIEATHSGDGSFVVDGHGADGSTEQLINQNGGFDGSRSYSAGGTVWLTVVADGDWTLSVRGT